MCTSIKEPCKCSEAEIKNFRQLLEKARTVTSVGLKERIRNAHFLAFHYEEKILVAIAALKRPNAGYKKTVFKEAGVPEA